MLTTSARLLRLLSLLQTGRFFTGATLATELEVHERTVRRDVERIRELGYAVHASSGVAGGYQLGRGPELPPLLFDDQEALAVALGLRSTAAGSTLGLEEAALRALAKLEQLLPKRLRKRIHAFQTSIVPLHHAGTRVDVELLSALAGACRSEEVIAFSYVDKQGSATTRRVEPSGLVHAGTRWYLVAWDVEREDYRTFRVDRIHGRPKSVARFVRRPLPEGGLAAYVARSVAVDTYAFKARVLLHAPYAQIAKQVSPLTGLLEPVDDKTCRLEAGGGSAHSLVLFIALLGVEFEILDPPLLKEAARELSQRLARAAGPAD